MTNRYDGKPFLKLLDSYVLWSIGHLDNVSAAGLEHMVPKLQQVYGCDGTWQDIVALQMELPDTLPATIKRIWENGSAKALAQGWSVDPLEFSRQFVDTNFPT